MAFQQREAVKICLAVPYFVLCMLTEPKYLQSLEYAMLHKPFFLTSYTGLCIVV